MVSLLGCKLSSGVGFATESSLAVGFWGFIPSASGFAVGFWGFTTLLDGFAIGFWGFKPVLDGFSGGFEGFTAAAPLHSFSIRELMFSLFDVFHSRSNAELVFSLSSPLLLLRSRAEGCFEFRRLCNFKSFVFRFVSFLFSFAFLLRCRSVRGSESMFFVCDASGTPESRRGLPSGVAVLILSSTSAGMSTFRKDANGELICPSQSIQVG